MIELRSYCCRSQFFKCWFHMASRTFVAEAIALTDKKLSMYVFGAMVNEDRESILFWSVEKSGALERQRQLNYSCST
ncbi:hypothetical protein IFM89_008738 [Coptis chinensis]|uniref:Uncharacterized protein n=1 Tax=Coptis chinensis TaxID=261450 RepID=A0A835GWW6_9MAGN|nr:hypothetical protein IFM89_008738 [Coptis chinensis]